MSTENKDTQNVNLRATHVKKRKDVDNEGVTSTIDILRNYRALITQADLAFGQDLKLPKHGLTSSWTATTLYGNRNDVIVSDQPSYHDMVVTIPKVMKDLYSDLLTVERQYSPAMSNTVVANSHFKSAFMTECFPTLFTGKEKVISKELYLFVLRTEIDNTLIDVARLFDSANRQLNDLVKLSNAKRDFQSDLTGIAVIISLLIFAITPIFLFLKG